MAIYKLEVLHNCYSIFGDPWGLLLHLVGNHDIATVRAKSYFGYFLDKGSCVQDLSMALVMEL